jgi:hypothetical protein
MVASPGQVGWSQNAESSSLFQDLRGSEGRVRVIDIALHTLRYFSHYAWGVSSIVFT